MRPAPGVPERYWNIGIRIEDDALVTATGCELMSRDVPVAAAEIEALMRESGGGHGAAAYVPFGGSANVHVRRGAP